ncbi:MAG: Fe-S oxidoreductase [Solidesulfovibrio magneticus str. Maddingley MBC34]|uniref:Fe-S oxidoreductase n=1 Tax=Solidesulfovibrio magneticus str. Maddingley MBC34 TaxID=1206767 RepID=K6H5H2_9BACT|nr:MAG: Fe-S oxidoreductase [Solidesulfovibrio magneticus str. Maddingley MBC34]
MPLTQMHVGSLGGFHHELYHPDTDSLFIEEIPRTTSGLLHVNALFWGKLLRPDAVRELILTLQDSEGVSVREPAYWAILTDSELFVKQVGLAVERICDHAIGIREFYRYVETLQILCRLYSELVYFPYLLTLQDGFVSFNQSSLVLHNTCLNPAANPYLAFIRRHCLPVVDAVEPDLVWLNGKITIATMAIARLIKRYHPKAHISVVGHSSEYYSLNKITRYLLRNEVLFSSVDSIVLDDSDESRQALVAALDGDGEIGDVPNLLYARRSPDGLRIEQTSFVRFQVTRPLTERANFRPTSKRVAYGLPPASLVDVKLFPEHSCYWNKCLFCGINQKYFARTSQDDGKDWDVGPALKCFETLGRRGIKFLWAIDEAIPPQPLRALAEGLITRGNAIQWQARSRFDPELLSQPDTCELLARAGLREIRFGLESGCPRVLDRMRKFPPGIFPGVVFQTIERFARYGVRVHCPMIIGFPTETADERRMTYDLLNHLCQQFDNFSFNINIFGFDIKSPLFSSWLNEDVTSVRLPCAARHFLGNLVEWDCADEPFNRDVLERERRDVMRRLLYPWMPESSETSPHLLYRLAETMRDTLTFGADFGYVRENRDKMVEHDRQNGPSLPSTVVHAKRLGLENHLMPRFYDWRTHHAPRVGSNDLEEIGEVAMHYSSSANPKTPDQQ